MIWEDFCGDLNASAVILVPVHADAVRQQKEGIKQKRPHFKKIRFDLLEPDHVETINPEEGDGPELKADRVIVNQLEEIVPIILAADHDNNEETNKASIEKVAEGVTSAELAKASAVVEKEDDSSSEEYGGFLETERVVKDPDEDYLDNESASDENANYLETDRVVMSREQEEATRLVEPDIDEKMPDLESEMVAGEANSTQDNLASENDNQTLKKITAGKCEIVTDFSFPEIKSFTFKL